jgi:hypothetical protein
MKSQKQTKKIFNICEIHTYLIKIEIKTIWRDDFRPKLTLNHPSPEDQKEKKVVTDKVKWGDRGKGREQRHVH